MSVEGVPSVDDVAAAIRAEGRKCGPLNAMDMRFARAVHALYAPHLERLAVLAGLAAERHDRCVAISALALRYKSTLESIRDDELGPAGYLQEMADRALSERSDEEREIEERDLVLAARYREALSHYADALAEPKEQD